MSKNITIDQTRCIRCQKCIKVCPQQLFHNNQEKHITVSTKGCIACGHCVAICPQEAIKHSDFPQGKILAFDRSELPSATQVELLIKSRRSNRAFSSEAIPNEFLQRIISAAHYASTASNQQEIKIIVITNAQILQHISTITIQTFINKTRPLNYALTRPIAKRLVPQKYKYAKIFKRMEYKYREGYDNILRNAQALILFYADKNKNFACQDANLAYQNASLMAEALGTAHFYTGFLCRAAEMDKKQKLQHILGISSKIYAGMALGMPLFKFNRYTKRNDCNLKIID